MRTSRLSIRGEGMEVVSGRPMCVWDWELTGGRTGHGVGRLGSVGQRLEAGAWELGLDGKELKAVLGFDVERDCATNKLQMMF